ncbi:MAG: hypothetical protein V1897_07860 [Pseudomonadota bacterium]
MKSSRGLLIVLSCAAVLMVIGCVSVFRSAKPQEDASGKEAGKISSEQTKSEETSKKPTDEEVKKLLATPPPPKDTRQPAGDPQAASEALIDPVEKEEVSRAALEFAGHTKNVIHVKTCYSKLYGGWYLMLYVQKGKKTALDQYSWNRKAKEWEIVYHLKEIPKKQVDFHLKGEVGDEKCFVLK